MIPLRPIGTTRNLGAPVNWNPETDRPCLHLPIADVVIDDRPYMMSLWEPTPAELKILNQGGAIQLLINGSSHPVVSVNAVVRR